MIEHPVIAAAARASAWRAHLRARAFPRSRAVRFEIEQYIPVSSIIQAVAAHYHYRPDQIIGESREAGVAEARQIGYFLARKMTSRSTIFIGDVFGGRDHSTILWGIKRIEARLHEQELADDINEIISAIVIASRKIKS